MLDEDTIRVAREIPLQRLLGAITGVRKTMLCPLHSEKSPSFVMYANGGWYCFGCGKSGQGALDFLIEMGETFPVAVNYLTSGDF